MDLQYISPSKYILDCDLQHDSPCFVHICQYMDLDTFEKYKLYWKDIPRSLHILADN